MKPNVRTVAISLVAITAIAGAALAQQHRLRKHTATSVQELSLQAANRNAGRASVKISVSGNTRTIKSNGIPSHKVGNFPNSGNPNAIKSQNYTFTVPANPRKGSATTLGLQLAFGVGVNGVPFDPGAAEFWQGQRNSGWQYEALSGAVTLGVDANYAHVQPNGAYHYHGLPVGLMQNLGWSSSKASPLIGWAADGFPIYAMTAELGGKVKLMQSSYRLKSGNRPGGSQPGGRYDGTFIQDYVYVAGAGDLDECNGATVVTDEFPNGTYAYFLTQTYPVIPRCHMGTPDSSFRKRR